VGHSGVLSPLAPTFDSHHTSLTILHRLPILTSQSRTHPNTSRRSILAIKMVKAGKCLDYVTRKASLAVIGLQYFVSSRPRFAPMLLYGQSHFVTSLTDVCIIQSLSSVVTPRSPELLPSSSPPSPPTPPSHGTSPATMPALSVACTSTPTVTTPTAAPAPVLTVRSKTSQCRMWSHAEHAYL